MSSRFRARRRWSMQALLKLDEVEPVAGEDQEDEDQDGAKGIAIASGCEPAKLVFKPPLLCCWGGTAEMPAPPIGCCFGS